MEPQRNHQLQRSDGGFEEIFVRNPNFYGEATL